MNTIAEFTIIGRVGEIRQVGTTLRVNIASSYSRKDNRGEGRAHPLERSHRLRRVHPRLRQA
jgi:single-strand DNA-binding protein